MDDLDYTQWQTVGWRKAKASNGGGGACVEVACRLRTFAVRDSKDSEGPVLIFEDRAWRDFLSGLRVGAR